MPQTIAEIEASTIENVAGAFDSFCEDISGMFGINVEGTASDRQLVTLKELKTDFKKITGVFIVEGKGAINGNFYVLLDQDALFTLAGTFVMLPENIIIQNRRSGREKEANEVADAVGEVGNLLVGAWDRFFREEMEGHEHLLQTGTFIGKPWLKPEENIGLAKETELVAVKYEMTIESFDPFLCMAAFPKSVFEPAPENEEETAEASQETPEQAQSEAEDKETVAENTDTSPEQTETQPDAEKSDELDEQAVQSEEEKVEPEKEPQESAEPVNETENETEKAEPSDDVGESPADAEPPAEIDETETARAPQDQLDESETESDAASEDRPVSKVIEQMTHSPAVLPGEISGEFLTDIKAQNVMRTDIAWAAQDDTVENVMNKMQQQNTGYALIGTPNAIQGIVSKSDIQGALSPYLQSIFSKWKRELDTATLQIKVRWIMSRPVHTVRPDAALSVVIETMCKHSVRSLPVADENGICGLVTVYTIFNALNAAGADKSNQQGQNTDVPALS